MQKSFEKNLEKIDGPEQHLSAFPAAVYHLLAAKC
jgi:hypothetical protein